MMARGLLALAIVGALAAGHSSAAQATFPGANGKIIFSTSRDGNIELYSMEPDGSAQANLTNTPIAGEDLPSWSPDGTRVTFVSSAAGNFEVFSMNADGSNQTNLSNHASFDADPVWCTDSRIVFVSLRSGTLDVWAMNSDGTGQVNLTPLTTGSPDDLPDCSPDGTKIVYESYTGAMTGIDILTMNADGTNRQVIVSNAADDVHPSWSPDGARILFERSGDIYAVNANGTGEQLIIGETSQESAAVWSPDGTKIAFTSNRNGAPDVYTANVDGTNQTRLTVNSGVSDDYADWQAAQAVGGVTELPGVFGEEHSPGPPLTSAIAGAFLLFTLFACQFRRVRS
jgi:Tol biopolymer transport system component